jgi:ribokinase
MLVDVRRLAALELGVERQHVEPRFERVTERLERVPPSRNSSQERSTSVAITSTTRSGQRSASACVSCGSNACTGAQALNQAASASPVGTRSTVAQGRSCTSSISPAGSTCPRIHSSAAVRSTARTIAAVARVAIVGSYGVGLTVELDRFPAAGETVVGRTFRADHGGKGSNQAVGCARLGARVDFLTAIGDDTFGHEAIALWQAEGVRAEAILTQAATMTAPIFVEPSGQNRIVVVPGALAELSRAHVDMFAARIAAADVCVVQLEIPVDTALYALEIARNAGVRTILNPAPAPPEPIAPEVDYLTPNETETASVAGAHGTLVLTLGAEGARIGGDRVPAFPATAVDTTGAGDAFTAAFAVALAEGNTDLEAVRWGCAAGANMVERAGVIPGLPTRAQLEQRLAAVPA